MRHFLTGILVLCAIGFGAIAQGTSSFQSPQQTPSPWRTFEGNWSVSGQVQTLPTEGAFPSATAQFSGAVAIESIEGFSRGFRGEAIAYDNGSGVMTGRAVWTDERGDRIFSTLRGETIATKRSVTGTITGGTGRYTGANGDYQFDWQYVVASDERTLQARTMSLRGRVRTGGR